jgi:hypothetical protein
MDERITADQLPSAVRRSRKWQVMLAVIGMAAFLLALIGGAVESRWLVWFGLVGFAVCLIALLVIAAATWLRILR